MDNFIKGTMIMVSRRMLQLLSAKIACAQTRNITKRVPWTCVQPWTLDETMIFRERQKVEQYEESKRLSMWEQNKPQVSDKSENSRMDHLHYKHSPECGRAYGCTWTDFPDDMKPKDSKILRVIKTAPVNPARRKPGCCPETASRGLL